MAVADELASNQLLAYFRFEEGPSRSVEDASGKGRTGSVMDDHVAKWVASPLAGGKYGKKFDGRKEDTVRVTNAAGMPTGNGARTVSYWFSNIRGNTAAFGLGCRVNGQGWNMRNSATRLHLDFHGWDCEWGAGTPSGCNEAADYKTRSGWNHVVVTYDGTNLVSYFNGARKTSSNPTQNPKTCPYHRWLPMLEPPVIQSSCAALGSSN